MHKIINTDQLIDGYLHKYRKIQNIFCTVVYYILENINMPKICLYILDMTKTNTFNFVLNEKFF